MNNNCVCNMSLSSQNFRKALVKKLQFPFTAYCLSIAYLHQFPTKSSRFCVSDLHYEDPYVVIADNSCPPLSSISITAILLQYDSNQMFIAIRSTKFMTVQFSIVKIVQQTSVHTAQSSILFFNYYQKYIYAKCLEFDILMILFKYLSK